MLTGNVVAKLIDAIQSIEKVNLLIGKGVQRRIGGESAVQVEEHEVELTNGMAVLVILQGTEALDIVLRPVGST